MKKIGEYLLDYLKGLGEDYVSSFFENYADKLKDWFVDKVENLDPKEIAQKAKDIKNKLISNFDKKIGEKPNFNDHSIFSQFNKKLVKNMIDEIFQEEKVSEEITYKYKNDLENFKMENNNAVNILLNGEEKDKVNLFLEMISKAFDFEKINKNEYNINIEFKTHLTKIKKIKIIQYNEKLKINLDNDNFDFIWYIIDEKIQEKIKTKDENLNILSETKPLIYIGYFDNVRPETKHTFSNSIFSEENFEKMKYHIMDSFILDKNQINDKDIFMKLIKKSLLFLLIEKNKIKTEKIINDIYDDAFPRMKFLFGNSVQNFQNFNFQITPIIFKKFLLKEKLSDSIKIKYIKLLGDYQKYLERKQKDYFEEFLSNNESIYKKENDKIKKKLCENMISFIKEKVYEEDNEKKEEKETKKEKEKEKKKEKQKQIEKMAKVNSIGEDDINKQFRIKFDDYLLKNSSIFINELIINNIKDKKIELYKNEIYQYYFGIYKNDLILSEKDKI